MSEDAAGNMIFNEVPTVDYNNSWDSLMHRKPRFLKKIKIGMLGVFQNRATRNKTNKMHYVKPQVLAMQTGADGIYVPIHCLPAYLFVNVSRLGLHFCLLDQTLLY